MDSEESVYGQLTYDITHDALRSRNYELAYSLFTFLISTIMSYFDFFRHIDGYKMKMTLLWNKLVTNE